MSLSYDDDWRLEEVELASGELRRRGPIASEVYVVVPADRDGEEIRLEMWGLRDQQALAYGAVDVMVERGRQVAASVVLARIPCGAWCVEGQTACRGDGVAICRRQADGCLAWGDAEACGGDTPLCSLGTCRADCIDECAAGEIRCAGPGGVQVCGQHDSDGCRDWSGPAPCDAGQTCSSGVCAEGCVDDCEPGASACLGDAVSACADLNLDGCLEWGPPQACPAGASCSNGACSEQCRDECVEALCYGTTLSQCGQFDSDPCLDRSPGSSCVPADPCLEGMCAVTGCTARPVTCDAPPLAECVDGDTKRVYDAIGTCTAGACDYPSREVDCPECPACDACAGVACESPPAPACVDASTLRVYQNAGTCSDGACSYGHVDVFCDAGCELDACVCFPTGWTRETIEHSEPHETDVVVGPDGRVHVVWHADGSLRHAERSPLDGGWRLDWAELRVPDATFGVRPSVAVDPAGRVHITSYQATGAGAMRHSYQQDDGTWSIDTAAFPHAGSYSSLGVDGAGGLHASHYRSVGGDLIYSYKAPGATNWTFEVVRDDGDVGTDTSLAVDAAGGVHIAYKVRWDSQVDWESLFYAYRPAGGSWSIRPVDVNPGVGSWASLAVDAAGGVHIAYTDLTNHDLRYAYKAAGSSPFFNTVVDGAGVTGYYPSLALDPAGGVHVSYHDETDADLRYAHRGADWLWRTYDVVTQGDAGERSSIAVANGAVHIVHFVDGDEAEYVVGPGCPP